MRGTRSLALGAIAACAVTPLAAQAATTASAKTNGPAYSVLANAKTRCRKGYVKTHVTVTVRRHGKRIKLHQVRCVRPGASGGSGVPGGNGVSTGSAVHPAPTFAVGLPTVAVTVSIIPTASAHTYAIAAGQSLSLSGRGILAGATGAGLSAVLVSGPAQGSLSLNRDGTLRYVPASGASGIQRFTYKVVDPLGETSTPAPVTVDVTPLAQDGLYSTPANQTLAIPSGGLLASDTGSGLTATLVGATADGSLAVQPDGSATYTPNAGFSGADTFTYQAVDADSLHSNTATVTINVGAQPPTVTPVTFTGAIANTTLHVGAGSVSGPHVSLSGTSALAGDVDPGGGTLSVTPGTIATSAGGSVTLASNGSFSYIPSAGFTGPTDSFSYEVDTSEGTSAAATATIDFASGRVWYLDGASATNGSGTSASPFNSAASAVAAASSAGDVIFLLSNYTGGISPGPGVTLEGAGAPLVVSGETLLASGSAPQIANGASPALTLGEGDVVAGVAVSGVSASGVNGFTILSSASISNASGGDALDVTGGSGTIGIGAPITSTSGHSVQIQGRTGGTVTLNGTVGDSGTGILVDSDTGAQITFNGAITAATGSSPAFTATGGGNVTATSQTNSLATTSGMALDISGSGIGSNGVQFASVSAGSSGHPTNGIVLNGTFGGDGIVTISGGTIQNTTGAGVQVTNAGTVDLAQMTITGSGGDGVDAVNVESLSIAHTGVLNSAAAGIAVTGDGSVAGQVAIIDSDTVSGQPGTAISIAYAGDAQAVLDKDRIGNGTVGSGSLTGDGIDLSDTSGTLAAEVGLDTIDGIATGMGISAQELSGSTLNLTVDGNAVTGATNGVSVVGGTGAACLNASSNALAGVNGLLVSQLSASGGFAIEGYTGLPGDLSAVQTFLETQTNSTLTALALGTSTSFTNGTCPLPAVLSITS